MASDFMAVRLHLPQIRVLEVIEDTPGALRVSVESTLRRLRCPQCGFRCHRVRDRRDKKVRALRVFVGLRVAGTGWGHYVTRMPRASKLRGLVNPWALRRRTWSRLLVPVGAGNPVVAGQAACRYSLTSPSHRVDFTASRCWCGWFGGSGGSGGRWRVSGGGGARSMVGPAVAVVGSSVRRCGAAADATVCRG